MINAIYNSLMEILDKQETNRLEQFRKAWDAYYGNLPKPLKVKPGMQDDNIRLNYCRLIVDKSVYFLFGKSLDFELEEGIDTTAEQWLQDCWQSNKKMTTLQKLAINGGVCGHCFIKILWNPGMMFPRLIVLDPETVTVTLAADDIDDVLSYKIQYPSRDPKSRKPIMVRQLIEKENNFWRVVD
ncbi:MAG: phage portal protein, partial [Anaerolineaceae bacterium]